MIGKSVLITGGTAGIGKAAGLVLARLGAEVTLLGRDPVRGAAAAAEIRAATGNPQVTSLPCDLMDRASVRKAVASFRETHPTLDVLINNAGLYTPTRELTADGVEKTFAALYLGHVQLTELLLDPLQSSPQGRVICVTCPPNMAKVQFDDLTLSKGYSALTAQSQAKGALMMYVRDLARRLAGARVTVNSMLPALMLKTDLLARMPFWFRVPVQLFGISAEKGAEAEVWLVTAPELARVTGRHFHGRTEKQLSRQVKDDAAWQRLWTLTTKLAEI